VKLDQLKVAEPKSEVLLEVCKQTSNHTESTWTIICSVVASMLHNSVSGIAMSSTVCSTRDKLLFCNSLASCALVEPAKSSARRKNASQKLLHKWLQHTYVDNGPAALLMW